MPTPPPTVKVKRDWVWTQLQESLANEKSRCESKIVVVLEGNWGCLASSDTFALQGCSPNWWPWFGKDQPCPLPRREQLLWWGGWRTRGHLGQAGGSAGRLPLLPGKQIFILHIEFHSCQADNAPTCLVPHFVHSLAAQLSQAPQLAPYYRHLKVQNAPHL